MNTTIASTWQSSWLASTLNPIDMYDALMPKTRGVTWTEDHFLIALNLYCKLPFGRLHKSNPLVIEAANRMARTPSSLAMKLCNFASLDPVQTDRGVKGLSGATRRDRQMWTAFHENLSELGPKSEQLVHDLFTSDDQREVSFLRADRVQIERSTSIETTEAEATVKVRRGQNFFRGLILNAYGVRCCISGLRASELLVASHIKPWRDFPEHRLDPRNGLCLSSIHDAAFDQGLISLDEDFKVVLSTRLKNFLPHPFIESAFVSYEGVRIHFPESLAEPDPAFLAYHRTRIFTT